MMTSLKCSSEGFSPQWSYPTAPPKPKENSAEDLEQSLDFPNGVVRIPPSQQTVDKGTLSTERKGNLSIQNDARSDYDSDNWEDAPLPELNLVTSSVIPGLWMSRDLVSLWVKAEELNAELTKLSTQKETDHDAYKLIFDNIILMRKEYKTYLNQYTDELDWLSKEETDTERLKECEKNYRLMHVTIIEVITYWPARLFKPYLIDEETLKVFEDNKIFIEPRFNQCKELAKSTLEIHIINTMFLLDLLFKNIIFRPKLLSVHELTNWLLMQLGELTLKFANAKKELTVETYTHITKSTFTKSLKYLDVEILNSDRICEIKTDYFTNRLAFLCFCQPLEDHEHLNDLAFLLFHAQKFLKKGNQTEKDRIFILLTIISKKVLSVWDELPGYTVAIQNLTIVMTKDKGSSFGNLTDEDRKSLAVLLSKSRNQNYPNDIVNPYLHLRSPIASIWEFDNCVHAAIVSEHKLKRNTVAPISCLFHGFSSLTCWEAPLSNWNVRMARKAFSGKNIQKEIERLSVIAIKVTHPVDRLAKLTAQKNKEKPSLTELDIQEEEKAVEIIIFEIIKEYKAFLTAYPHHSFLIGNPTYKPNIKEIHALLESHESIQYLMVKLGEYYKDKTAIKIKEIDKSFGSFINKSDDWEETLNDIFNNLDHFVETWGVNIISSTAHIYIIRQKLTQIDTVAFWSNINVVCLSLINWHAALYIKLKVTYEPIPNEDNYISKCLNRGRLSASIEKRMKSGIVQECYQVIKCRVQHGKCFLTPSELQLIQVLEPFCETDFSESAWCCKLNSLSIDPDLGNYNASVSTCISYLYFLYKKHFNRLKSPDISPSHWKESKQILQQISGFLFQGSFSHHWHQQTKCGVISIQQTMKLLSIIEESQSTLLHPPEAAETINTVSQQQELSKEGVTARKKNQQRTKKDQKPKHISHPISMKPTVRKKKSLREIDEAIPQTPLTSSESNSDSEEHVTKKTNHDERSAQIKRELEQAEESILYDPLKAISYFSVYQKGISHNDIESLERVTWGLAEASIRLLRPAFRVVVPKIASLERLKDKQIAAIHSQTYRIPPNLYAHLMSLIEESCTICANVTQLADVYYPYISNFFKISIVTITTDEKRASFQAIKQQCVEVYNLMSKFEDYINLIKGCIENRKILLSYSQFIENRDGIGGSITATREQLRHKRAEVVKQARLAIKKTESKITKLKSLEINR